MTNIFLGLFHGSLHQLSTKYIAAQKHMHFSGKKQMFLFNFTPLKTTKLAKLPNVLLESSLSLCDASVVNLENKTAHQKEKKLRFKERKRSFHRHNNWNMAMLPKNLPLIGSSG